MHREGPGRAREIALYVLRYELWVWLPVLPIFLISFAILKRYGNLDSSFTSSLSVGLSFTSVFAFANARLALMRIIRHIGSLFDALLAVIQSYLAFILAFSMVYGTISLVDVDSFSEKLDWFTSLYFAITTTATVGFGDISPKTIPARVAVCINVVMGVFYSITIFAIFSSYLSTRILENLKRPP
jgi:CBS domain containing-hemolysin-like protein